MNDATILIVDDDEVLGQILTRVLSQQGYRVERATEAAQALRLARDHPPQLGLLDLCLPDQDGTELARKLRGQVPDLPLILMTAYPLSLRDQPERTEGFARVLTKPLNLQELRCAVDAALGRETAAAPRRGEPAPQPTPPEPVTTPDTAGPPEAATTGPERETASPVPPPGPPPRGRRWLAWAGAGLAAVLLALGVAAGSRYLGQSGEPLAEAAERPAGAELVEGRRDTLRVPADVLRGLGVRTAVARQALDPQSLELPGSLNLDPSRLVRVHARFGGDVVELGQVEEGGGEFATAPRPVRFGDKVKKDQLLCVVWSKDLGEKKSELVDALSQLRTDRQTLEKLEELYQTGSTSEASVRLARRSVEADLNAVARAERTLRVWRLSEAEIRAVKEEAEQIRRRQGQRDAGTERDWARVEVRAPFAGTVVERNVAVGDIVDTTADLFKVADMSRLAVFASAYEEDLGLLRRERDRFAPEPVPWQVFLTSDPARRPLKSPGIEKVGLIVDPNQHTALVFGRVDNKDGQLRVGQFVTATLELPPPPGVVSVPAAALDEDGQASYVVVRPDPDKPRFQLRRVRVLRRFNGTAYIASEVTSAQRTEGIQPLRPGEWVVTSGAVQLRAALEEARAKARVKKGPGQ
jgi:membrane fusion protein, heavy metal efflux system